MNTGSERITLKRIFGNYKHTKLICLVCLTYFVLEIKSVFVSLDGLAKTTLIFIVFGKNSF